LRIWVRRLRRPPDVNLGSPGSHPRRTRTHSHEAPPRDLVDLAEWAILEVAQDDSRKDFRSTHDLLDSEIDKLEYLSREGEAITGTASGFQDMSRRRRGRREQLRATRRARPPATATLGGRTEGREATWPL
jgi:replicative DNA helicase